MLICFQVSNLHERLRKMTDERNFYRNQFEKVSNALQTYAGGGAGGGSSPAAAAAAAAAAAVAASQHGQDLTLQVIWLSECLTSDLQCSAMDPCIPGQNSSGQNFKIRNAKRYQNMIGIALEELKKLHWFWKFQGCL